VPPRKREIFRDPELVIGALFFALLFGLSFRWADGFGTIEFGKNRRA
jgi:hypothetical protein